MVRSRNRDTVVTSRLCGADAGFQSQDAALEMFGRPEQRRSPLIREPRRPLRGWPWGQWAAVGAVEAAVAVEAAEAAAAAVSQPLQDGGSQIFGCRTLATIRSPPTASRKASITMAAPVALV